MSAGAFSDKAVIEASAKILCVFVDCDWGKKNNDLSEKFQVRGYPTVAFCDPDGNVVAKLQSRDPAAVAAQIADVVKQYGKAAFENFEKASVYAKESKKPVLYLFTKPGINSSLAAAVADPSLKELLELFVVAQSELIKGNADAKALSITDSALLVLDPAAELAKAKPLLKLTGKKDLKEVKKQLEAVLLKFTDGGGDK